MISIVAQCAIMRIILSHAVEYGTVLYTCCVPTSCLIIKYVHINSFLFVTEYQLEYLPASCRGICSNLDADHVRDFLDPIMEDLAKAYLRILEKQEGKRKEFFGLRDFYRYVCLLQPEHP